ncbi:hypothetical protein CBM2618_A180010 [Cupriavidus taiwanensis]|nr:hypothetical protein CBM2591_A230004 [Cupriavidus taiwanensis]SOZ78795.1 hypothetical protein CBM2618_A180010 [Cupriavidus taiwanensis]SOZ86293.1 hypothetical protein CBM2621_A170011 [Cupriavidus taiwanensis]SPD43914.1 protein of unknown function [Cupriavidus taiwanensis]
MQSLCRELIAFLWRFNASWCEASRFVVPRRFNSSKTQRCCEHHNDTSETTNDNSNLQILPPICFPHDAPVRVR